MNAKKQIILFWGICLIIALVIVWLFIIPLSGTIKQISSDLVETKTRLAIIHNEKGEVEGVESICNKIDPDLQKMEALFVNKDVPIEVIEFLEDMAVISGLSIEISPASLDGYEDEIWDFVGFRLSLYGSYINFMKFLEKIETGPFLIEMYDLSIREMSDREGFSYDDVGIVLTAKIFAE